MTESKQFFARQTEADFDHLVVILRDQLEALTPQLRHQGFTLTPLARHSLGSINQVIALGDSYIELLGWPAGTTPLRKEIANQPIGLDALVFRSYDAHKTYERLKQEGFAVQPVQPLERPTPVGEEEVTVRFSTVRFAEQPLAGLRLYFCQHLTPEYVWANEYTHHRNKALALTQITVKAPDAQAAATVLGQVAGVQPQPHPSGAPHWQVPLGNAQIEILQQAQLTRAQITDATIRYADQSERRLGQLLDVEAS